MAGPKEIHPRVIALGTALRKWQNEQDEYPPYNNLAKKLGIPKSPWNSISNSAGTTDMEYYARVYAESDIPEADPRTFPTLSKPDPHGHPQVYLKPWTEQEWQNWLDDHNNGIVRQPKPTRKPKKPASRNGSAAPPRETIREQAARVPLGGLQAPRGRPTPNLPTAPPPEASIDALFTLLSAKAVRSAIVEATPEIVEAVAQRVSELIVGPREEIKPPARSLPVHTDVFPKQARIGAREMITILNREFERIKGGNPEEVIRFVEANRDVIGPLLGTLNVLTQKKDALERSLDARERSSHIGIDKQR